MANFPTYPATTLEQGVDLVIFSSNQMHDVINGDATATVETETGLIPTLRKALVDNFFFKSPVAWSAGSTETVFNQLRYFENGILSGYYYAPSATTANPVPMQGTPVGDSNWTLYALKTEQLASDVYPWYFKGATGYETEISPPYIFDNAIVTINGVIQIQGEAFTIKDSKIILAEPLGLDPSTGLPNKLFAFIGKTTASTSYVEKNLLSSTTGAAMVGLPSGGNLLQAQYFVTPEQFGAIGDGVTDDTQAILKTITFANTNNIQVRADKNYRFTSSIAMSGIRWYGGTFTGNGGTMISTVSCWMENVRFEKCYVKMLGGDCRFYRNIFSNATSTAAFLMQAMTSEGTLDFSYNEMYGCKYAILQQGTGEVMTYGRYSNNYIHDIKGDAIELNVVQKHYTEGLIIENNHIANVDASGQGANWGIGIGVAGSGPYGVDVPDSQYVHNFSIVGNRVYNCRQCLHVEMGKNFTIRDNEVYPNTAVSTGTGLTTCGVALYGCQDFEVDGLTGYLLNDPSVSTRMVFIDWGVNSGRYAGPPINFTIKNLDIPESSIEIATSGSDDWENSTIVSNINCNVFKWRGLPSSSTFNNIRCRSIDFIGQHGSGEGSGGGFYTRSQFTYMKWVGCTALSGDETTVSFAKIYTDRCDQVGNNFGVPTAVDGTGHRGPVLTTISEQYFTAYDEFPGGREFPTGTVIHCASGKKHVVTVGGAFFSANEKIKATVTGQTYLQSNALNWASNGYAKAAGTKIVIPGAGANGGDLVTTIARATYVTNSLYTIDIADPIVTPTAENTQIKALNPVTFVTVNNA